MSRIIVALDGKSIGESEEIARELTGEVWGFKINDLAFYHGIEAIESLNKFGNLMLDFKWHDIPNTIKNVAERFKDPAFKICTVHASGGIPMMRAAVEELGERVAAVTALTSLNDQDCVSLFGRDSKEIVPWLTVNAEIAGCEYLVCSGLELQNLKECSLKKIVPGIRPLWFQEKGDQMRVMTPKEAMDAGADFLVMGRPILTGDPRDNAKRTNDEIS